MSVTKEAQSFSESFKFVILFLRLSGLFPFSLDKHNNRMHISKWGIAISVFHLSFYTSVNIKLLLRDWHEFAQPSFGHTVIGIFGNLLLRLLGFICALLILLHIILSCKSSVRTINLHMAFLDDFIAMGIDVRHLSRRIRYLGISISLLILSILATCSWHSVYFYKRIMLEDPELVFYFVVTLATFYKLMFLFYIWIQLFIVYTLSGELNAFLMTLMHSEECEAFKRNERRNMAWQQVDRS